MTDKLVPMLVACMAIACGGSDGDGGTDRKGEGGGGGTFDTPRTDVPEALQGSWAILTSGDTISGHSAYDFAADGAYTLATLIESQWTGCFFSWVEGTVAVEGGHFTLYPNQVSKSESESCDPNATLEPQEVGPAESYLWEVGEDSLGNRYLRLTDEAGTTIDWYRSE